MNFPSKPPFMGNFQLISHVRQRRVPSSASEKNMTITGHWAVSLWDVYGIGENGASLTCHESLGRVHYWCDLLFCAINIMIIINNYNIYSCLIYYYYVNTCTVHYIYYIYINGLHQPRALDMFNECQDPPKNPCPQEVTDINHQRKCAKYIQWLVGGLEHDFYSPFHIWDVIRNPLKNSYFSRWLLHHQPDDIYFVLSD